MVPSVPLVLTFSSILCQKTGKKRCQHEDSVVTNPPQQEQKPESPQPEPLPSQLNERSRPSRSRSQSCPSRSRSQSPSHRNHERAAAPIAAMSAAAPAGAEAGARAMKRGITHTTARWMVGLDITMTGNRKLKTIIACLLPMVEWLYKI